MLSAQRPAPTAADRAMHAQEVGRLLITDAMVIYGNAKPPFGPVDILVVDGLITYVGPLQPSERERQQPDAVIDAAGKYVMPGMVNTHMHWHEWRDPDIPQPIQYERNLYLASGTTTARELGGDFRYVEAVASRERRARDHRPANGGLRAAEPRDAFDQ